MLSPVQIHFQPQSCPDQGTQGCSGDSDVSSQSSQTGNPRLCSLHKSTFFIYKGKDKKDQVHTVTGHKGPEGEFRYSSTL